ncbi:MAG: hypothetical protein IKM35_04670 [Bacteroidaceae bacterium]|nr:hypothetical protein [Bacteroidaceae bacterium]
MQRLRFVIFVFLFPLCWNIVFMFWCNEIRNSKSLVEVIIPESTKVFLDSIGSRIIEGVDNVVVVEIDSIDKNSWTNITDYGQDDSDDLYRYEIDSLFVFYSDLDELEIINDIQQYAIEAIEPLIEVMGHYIYPYQVRGRKLPIYICNKEETYQKVCQTLTHRNTDFTDTWGLHVHAYCGLETQTSGVILNKGNIYELSNTPEIDLKATLWHEMNHYVFFQSLDLSKELTPYVWMYEGLADYFASLVREQTLLLSESQKQSIMKNTLQSSFDPYTDNYSGGELFYRYFEMQYGKQDVLTLVKSFYTMSLIESFNSMNKDVYQEEQQWKEFVKNNDYEQENKIYK